MTRCTKSAIAVGLAVIAGVAPAAASAADDDRPFTFTSGQAIPVTLTLHSSGGEPRGRQTPIYSKYRPRLDFGDGRQILCVVTIPREVRTIAPGQTADASLGCQEAVTVRRPDPQFVVVEGNKQVGVGRVRLPAP